MTILEYLKVFKFKMHYRLFKIKETLNFFFKADTSYTLKLLKFNMT